MASAEEGTSSESQASGLKSRDSNDQSRDLASTGPETVADREVTKNDVMVSIFECFLPFQRFMSLQHHLWIFPSKVSLFPYICLFSYNHTGTICMFYFHYYDDMAVFTYNIISGTLCMFYFHTITLAVNEVRF